MRITVVRPDELGPSELSAWRSFQDAVPSLAHPFLAPEFVRAVGRVRPRVRVGVLADGCGVHGFFPFERGALGYGAPVAAGLTDAHGLVHAAGADWDAQELLRACGLAVWDFDHLVEGQPGFAPYEILRAPSPVMDLSGGFAVFRAEVRARSRSFLAELERKGRVLAREHGDVRFTLTSSDSDVLGRLMAWKSEQYRRTGRTDRFAQPWVRELVESLLDVRTEAFSAVLSVVHAGGVPVAGHLGLRRGPALAGWFPAYDHGYRRYSPGLFHHLLLAEACAADGITEVDMGRGAKSYKSCFRSRDIMVSEGRVVRRVPATAVHWVRREPVRRLRHRVMEDPRLYRRADSVLKGYARVRTRLLGSDTA